MRLSGMIAERFGRLEAASLEGLGDGLTVVLGPNEAGKTSFTTLVRYVLYGYPTKRGPEPGYDSDAGKRIGRLVFEDGDGRWTVERVEGTHGGPVAVRALSGPERPGLVDEVTRGIGRDAFRVVFGFGLDEMAEIEAERGSGVDILSRLYSARVGLGVSPSDVRARLESEAASLFRPAAKNPVLNAIKSEMSEVRRRISALEAEAASYSEQQARLGELGVRLEEARSARDAAVARASELAALAQKVEDLEARMAEESAAAETARARAAASAAEGAALTLDERLLGIAAELDAVLADLSGFRSDLRTAEEQARDAAGTRDRIAAGLRSARIDEGTAAGADVGPEALAGLDRWRDRLAALDSRADMARHSADAARDALVGAEKAAPAAPAAVSSRLPAGAVVAVGLAIAALGVVGGDWVQAALGIVVALGGAALLVRSPRTPQNSDVTVRVEDARRAAGVAEAAARREAESLQVARAEWRRWLHDRGLGSAGDDPLAVATLVSAVKEYCVLLEDAERQEAASARLLSRCEEYRSRLAALAGDVAPGMASCPLADVPAYASRLDEALKAARATHGRREELARDGASAQALAAESERKLAAAAEALSELLETHAASGADAISLAADAEAAAQAARETGDAYDAIAAEHASLAAVLDTEGRDSAMSDARLELAGLVERRESALERYAVLAVAERLMARTQEFNERERQPAVVARASELFSTITAGRYVAVTVPAEGGRFVVFDADSRPSTTDRLSTGTAQQLYLALRIALIESLDGLGPGLPVLMDDVFANFDPERKRGSIEALADLAVHRQVVLFTCHPETAELVRQAVPDRTELALDRC